MKHLLDYATHWINRSVIVDLNAPWICQFMIFELAESLLPPKNAILIDYSLLFGEGFG